MNRADQDVPEYFEAGSDFLADDEVPESLLTVLRVLAEDFVPETRGAAQQINAWLAESQPAAGEPAVGRLAQGVGVSEFTLRGQAVSAMAQPHRFYLLQRVQDAFSALSVEDQSAVSDMLAACGMAQVLDISLDRRIGRTDNLEVWEA
jgi:hypothetical protein